MILTDYFLKSRSSKLVISLGLICMLISAYKYCSLLIIIIQGFLFFSLSRHINCGIYGGCTSMAIIPIIITIGITLLLIFDILGIFDKYKKNIRHLYHLFEDSNETYFKYLIYPEEYELSDRYKKRNIPKIFNKNYKYIPTNKSLGKKEDDEAVQFIKSINSKNIIDAINNIKNT